MDSEEYELLRRYLLHRLEAGERDEVRRRLLTEPRLFELASDVENDLIDAFAAGTLKPEDAGAVAELIAATGDQQRVDFARALAQQAGLRTSAGEIARRPSLPFRLAAAAAFVFAISTAILLIAVHRISSNTRSAQQSPQRAPGLIAVFELKPVLRGSSGGQMLTVSANAKVVSIRVLAEPGYDHYEMALRDPFGNVLWSQTTPDRAPLELLVPTAVLRTGRYEMTVDGERANAPSERIEDRDVDVALQ
jgi:hypothetical protein